MKLQFRVPDIGREVDRSRARYHADIRAAELYATDQAARLAQQDLKARARGAALGRLGNAIGYTSMAKETRGRGYNAQVVAYRSQGNPYGVIYARGGDESLAGGALESYTQGADIRIRNKRWLAFQTDAVPRRIGRYRTTPERYNKSGLATSIGKLEFRPISPDRALLVVKNVSLSPKNGRAKALGPRKTRTRIPVKEVVAFVLIKYTRRDARFNKDAVVLVRAQQVPELMARKLEDIAAARGER